MATSQSLKDETLCPAVAPRREHEQARGRLARRDDADHRRDARPARRDLGRRRHRAHRRRPRRLPRVAQGARAAPRRAGPPVRRGAARGQGRPRAPGHARGRQDPLRRRRRSAGDDRHLRLRGRPVAPALRPDDRHRAGRPPHDGELASARRRRRDLGVQLPGRGLGVELGAGDRLRRLGRLEALGEDAAHRARDAEPVRARRGEVRRGAEGPLGRADRRPRCGRGAGPGPPGSRWSRRPARRRWAARSARRSRSASAARSSSSAATTRRSSARRPTST